MSYPCTIDGVRIDVLYQLNMMKPMAWTCNEKDNPHRIIIPNFILQKVAQNNQIFKIAATFNNVRLVSI